MICIDRVLMHIEYIALLSIQRELQHMQWLDRSVFQILDLGSCSWCLKQNEV